MIPLIRKKFGKRAFTVFIWLTVFLMGGMTIITGLFRRFWGVPQMPALASVNGQEITQRDFQRKVMQEEQYISLIRQRFGKNADYFLQMQGLTGSSEERALNALISQKLLAGAAKKMDLGLSPEYVSKHIHDPAFLMQNVGDLVPPALLVGGSFNYGQMLRTLQKQGTTAQCLENAVTDRLKEQLVLQLARGAAYAPEVQIKEVYDRAYRTKQFTVIEVPLAPYKKQVEGKPVSDEILRSFFMDMNKRTQRYWTPEKRSGSVLTFENAPAHFEAEAKTMLNRAKPVFDKFVERFKGTKSVIGLTEYKQGDQMLGALFSLAHKGERTVLAQNGKQLIVELTDIEPAKERDFGGVKAQVLRDYQDSQAVEALAKDLNELKLMDEAQRIDWIKKHPGKVLTQTTGMLDPDKADGWKDVEKEGLTRYQLSSLSKQGQKMTAVGTQNGYVIILSALGEVESGRFEDKKRAIVEQLTRANTNVVAAGFVASLEKSAKIKRNKTFTKQR